jgi:hypothetical protein
MTIRHQPHVSREYLEKVDRTQSKRQEATRKRDTLQAFYQSFFPLSTAKTLRAKYDEMEVNDFILVRKYNLSRNDYWIEVFTKKDLLAKKRLPDT